MLSRDEYTPNLVNALSNQSLNYGNALTIGVLALQGSFIEHRNALLRLHQDPSTSPKVILVKNSQDLMSCDGLIIPGGESTTMSRLLTTTVSESSLDRSSLGLLEALQNFVSDGRPVWGTCAGLILLATPRTLPILTSETTTKRIVGLGGLDVLIQRNAFGSQIHSCIRPIDVHLTKSIDTKTVDDIDANQEWHSHIIPGIFIRAPVIQSIPCGSKARVLADVPGMGIVAVQQGRVLGTAFHPELTSDLTFHRYFYHIVLGWKLSG